MNKTEQKTPKRGSTSVKQAKFIESLGTGSIQYNITMACQHAGIGRTTFYDWMRIPANSATVPV